MVLVDDTGALLSHLRHIAKEKRWTDGSIGRFLYAFLEQLMAKDLHHLEEIEDRIEELEERVLAGELENFNAPMAELRKETQVPLVFLLLSRCAKTSSASSPSGSRCSSVCSPTA